MSNIRGWLYSIPNVLVSEMANSSFFCIVSFEVYVGKSSLLKQVWALQVEKSLLLDYY